MLANKKKELKSNDTFIIEIKGQENNSWQGVLTWVEQQKTKPFRSALELITMMDSALNKRDE